MLSGADILKLLVKRYSVLTALYDKYAVPFYAVIILLVILFVLFAGNNVGLSDNGDFSRVMDASSLLFNETDKSFTYIDEYRISLTENSAIMNAAKILFSLKGVRYYPSIQIVFVRISVVLNLFVNALTGSDPSVYRLGFLGCIYALMYTAVLSFLLAQFKLKKRIADIIIKCVIIIGLCDVGYIAYFNSLYGEALQHIAFIFCIAMLVRFLMHKIKKADIFLGTAGAIIYGWSKFFNIPLACLFIIAFAAIAIVKSRESPENERRFSAAIPAAAGVVSLVLLASIFLSVPSWMNICTTYNAIFYGVVRDVPDETAARYLGELGLPPEMTEYKDTNYYVTGITDSLDENGFADELAGVSQMKVLSFYLSHPARLWHQMKILSRHNGLIRPFYLANYGESHPRMTLSSRFSLWSSVRSFLPFDSFIGNLAVTAAFLAAGFFCFRRKFKLRYLIGLYCLLCAALAYSFIIPMVSNGEADLAKHMFAFVEFIDVLFLSILVCFAAAITERGKNIILPVISLLMISALVLPPILCSVSQTLAQNKKHDYPEKYAYVTFGTYEGKDLVWLVVSYNADTALLFCTDLLSALPYDSANNNSWTESGIKSWLSDTFLSGFSIEEKEMMLPQINSVLLTVNNRHEADYGYSDFYCSHIPSLAARDYDSAYKVLADDIVTLPDIDMISELSSSGYCIAGNKDYWLETAYFNNSTMVRYVSQDGYIYFTEAKTEKHIRPVIKVSLSEAAISGGTGSYKNPFILTAS
jgi:hypothetical protein